MISRWSSFDALSTRDLYALLWLRQSVLVLEQACPYPDIDGRDPEAEHLALHPTEDSPPVGYARILPPNPETGTVSFGRLALAPDHRGSGLGRRLVAESLSRLAERWPAQDVLISAQLYLERFYGSFGFQRVGDVYDDVGIDHIDMRLTRSRDHRR